MVVVPTGTYYMGHPVVCWEDGRLGIQGLGREGIQGRIEPLVLRWMVEDDSTLRMRQ